jgi:hypothetical protein
MYWPKTRIVNSSLTNPSLTHYSSTTALTIHPYHLNSHPSPPPSPFNLASAAEYRGPGDDFPFMAFNILGGTHILLATAMIITGVVHVALGPEDRLNFLLTGGVSLWCPIGVSFSNFNALYNFNELVSLYVQFNNPFTIDVRLCEPLNASVTSVTPISVKFWSSVPHSICNDLEST